MVNLFRIFIALCFLCMLCSVCSGYASNHKKGDVALASMSKNQKFKAFLNKCRTESDQNPATLESYLILPIQRLCVLLFV